MPHATDRRSSWLSLKYGTGMGEWERGTGNLKNMESLKAGMFKMGNL